MLPLLCGGGHGLRAHFDHLEAVLEGEHAGKHERAVLTQRQASARRSGVYHGGILGA
jgi:hypothetical protein